MKFVFTVHALEEMQRRGITREQIEPVLANPDQKVTEYDDVICYQSTVDIGGKAYLMRVMVNEIDAKIVTVYRTSKISKYWRTEK